MKKVLILSVGISAVAIAEVVLTIIDSPLKSWVFNFFHACQTMGIVAMMSNGTFVKTRYFIISLFLVGTLFIGGLVTMVHSQAASAIMLISVGGILISYFIHYWGKKNKSFLDHMKLLTLLILFPLPLIFFRPISAEMKEGVQLLGHMISAVTIIVYLVTTGASFGGKNGVTV